MKKLIIPCLAVAIFSLSACTTVERERNPSVRTTTTTEESTTYRAASSPSTTETRTIRSY